MHIYAFKESFGQKSFQAKGQTHEKVIWTRASGKEC